MNKQVEIVSFEKPRLMCALGLIELALKGPNVVWTGDLEEMRKQSDARRTEMLQEALKFFYDGGVQSDP